MRWCAGAYSCWQVPQPLAEFAFSEFMLVAWSQPRWEYLHHGNWQTLPSQGLFVPGGLVVKHLPACCCIIKIAFQAWDRNLPGKWNDCSGTELLFLLSLATLVTQLRYVHTTSSSATVGCAFLTPTSATIIWTAKMAAMSILVVRWFPYSGLGC